MDHVQNRNVWRNGFTLLELLAVMAIVAVAVALAGLWLHHMGTRCHRSKEALCQANLKQLFIALDTYTQDCADLLPEACCSSGASGSNWYQVLVTEGYCTDKGAFVCPTDPSPETFNTGPNADRKGRPYRGVDPHCYYYDSTAKHYRTGDGHDHEDKLFPGGGSYGLNRDLRGTKIERVTHPSKTPFLMDSVHPSFEDGTRATPIAGWPTIMPIDAPFAGPHNARFHGGENVAYVKEDVDADARSPERLAGGNNVLFLDGHVEFVSGSALGNRAPKCDTDATKKADGTPFETDPTEPGCGEEVD